MTQCSHRAPTRSGQLAITQQSRNTALDAATRRERCLAALEARLEKSDTGASPSGKSLKPPEGDANGTGSKLVDSHNYQLASHRPEATTTIHMEKNVAYPATGSTTAADVKAHAATVSDETSSVRQPPLCDAERSHATAQHPLRNTVDICNRQMTRSGRLAAELLAAQAARQGSFNADERREKATRAIEARLASARRQSAGDIMPNLNTVIPAEIEGSTDVVNACVVTSAADSVIGSVPLEVTESSMSNAIAELSTTAPVKSLSDITIREPLRSETVGGSTTATASGRMTRSGQLAMQQLAQKQARFRDQDPTTMRTRKAAAVERRLISADSQSIELQNVALQQCETDLCEDADACKVVRREPTCEAEEKACVLQRFTRTRALALRAKAAADEAAYKRYSEAQQRLAEQMAIEEAHEAERRLRQTQDHEFQHSLLSDQLKDLVTLRNRLQADASQLEAEAGTCRASQLHAERRLERFGTNPRLSEEVESAAARLVTINDGAHQIEKQLSELEMHIAHKREMLAALCVEDA